MVYVGLILSALAGIALGYWLHLHLSRAAVASRIAAIEHEYDVIRNEFLSQAKTSVERIETLIAKLPVSVRADEAELRHVVKTAVSNLKRYF